MKKLLVTIAAVLVSVSAFAQGTVNFNNRTGSGDARITIAETGAPAGSLAGAQAQLYLVGAGGALTALSPATPFRTSSAAAQVFITGIDVVVPGVPAGSPATFRVRAWANGSDYDSALTRGQSGDVTVASLGGVPPGGGAPIPTPDLSGLQSFTIATIPEPSTIALGVLGAAALFIRRRK